MGFSLAAVGAGGFAVEAAVGVAAGVEAGAALGVALVVGGVAWAGLVGGVAAAVGFGGVAVAFGFGGGSGRRSAEATIVVSARTTKTPDESGMRGMLRSLYHASDASRR